MDRGCRRPTDKLELPNAPTSDLRVRYAYDRVVRFSNIIELYALLRRPAMGPGEVTTL